MGYIVPGICQRRKIGSSTQKAILMALASYAWDDGSNVWVSKTTLAADLELGRRTIQEAVAALIDKGILTETGKKSAERGYTIEYRINLDVIEALPLTREIRKPTARKAPAATPDPTKPMARKACNAPAVPSQSVRLTAPKRAADNTIACASRTQVSNKYINKNAQACTASADPQIPMSRDDRLRDLAERLKIFQYVAPSVVSTALAAEMIGRGFVTKEVLKRHGIAC